MKLRLSFGILPKLLLTMLVVTLIPLGAIWYLNYRAESESLSRQIEQRPSSQEVVISHTTGQPAAILSVPVWRLDKVVGVLVAGTSVTDVSTTITNVKIGETGFVFLVDDQGKVIAHPSARDSLNAHLAVAGLGAEPKKQIVFAEASGKRGIAVAENTKYGWTLVAQQDYDEAYAPVGLANRNALILLGITVLFVLLVSYALASRLTQPIRRLTQIADGISRGNLGAGITETKRSDEIGSLARAIERLRASVKLALDTRPGISYIPGPRSKAPGRRYRLAKSSFLQRNCARTTARKAVLCCRCSLGRCCGEGWPMS